MGRRMQKEMMAMATEDILATLADLVNDPENNEENGDWGENAKEPNDKGEKPPIRESCEGVGIPIRWGKWVYGLHSYL